MIKQSTTHNVYYIINLNIFVKRPHSLKKICSLENFIVLFTSQRIIPSQQ